MTIETRIKKLEKKIITPTKLKYHVVLVEHGASEKEAIQKFKDHNELLPSGNSDLKSNQIHRFKTSHPVA